MWQELYTELGADGFVPITVALDKCADEVRPFIEGAGATVEGQPCVLNTDCRSRYCSESDTVCRRRCCTSGDCNNGAFPNCQVEQFASYGNRWLNVCRP